MDNYDRFEAWLDRRAEQPAEVIAGLHAGFVPVTMDSGGMDAVPRDRLAAGGYDEDRAFVRHMIEKAGVAAIPPSVFYDHPEECRRYVRFAFCQKRETMEAAVARREKLCD